MKNNKLLGILTLTFLAANAQAFDVGVGVKGGTLGLGAEATFKVSERFNVRASVNHFSRSDTFDESGVSYDGDATLSTYGLTADWHPFKGSFRISAGVMNNGNEFKMVASCKQSCDVDGNQYQSNALDPGKINAMVDFKSMAPYAGIGWGNAMSGGKWYFGADIGVLFQGTPQASLTATGKFDKTSGIPGTVSASDPTFQAQLKKEEASLQDDMNNFDMYPVINFNLGYRF
ncbi:hypothetical protein EV700_2163 [Fluviicoccus keumensis]|uniref:Outer membrane protein with beta-barrel domain n=1 Tax=Fluviicoccus keumensis TaxID=1435465 RepID=A0A4Q7Z5P3_9GAMM|nr:hypothetical protein [Fluviicoccus keumensis]RZU45344.1 hypothetical protein EV700_2163 [Fluviicoccus keumensis]